MFSFPRINGEPNFTGYNAFFFLPTSAIASMEDPVLGIINTTGITYTGSPDWFQGYSINEKLSFKDDPALSDAGISYPVLLQGSAPVDKPEYLTLFSEMVHEEFIVLLRDNNDRMKILGTLQKGLRFLFKTEGVGYAFEFKGDYDTPPAFLNGTITVNGTSISTVIPPPNIYIRAATWTDGSGVPSPSYGNLGDWYIDTSTGDYYSKNTGIWVLEGNFSNFLYSQLATTDPYVSGQLYRDGYDTIRISRGNDADYLSYINAVEALTGALTVTHKNALRKLIKQLKSHGLWDRLDIIRPYVGDVISQSFNLKNPALYRGTYAASGVTFSTAGITFDGVFGFENTNYNIPVGRLNNCMLVISVLNETVAQGCVVGARNTATDNSSCEIFPTNSNTLIVRVNSANGRSVQNTYAPGIYSACRYSPNGAGSSVCYKFGTPVLIDTFSGGPIASVTVPNVTLYVGARRTNTGFSNPFAGTVNFFMAGGAFTASEVTIAEQIINEFNTAVR